MFRGGISDPSDYDPPAPAEDGEMTEVWCSACEGYGCPVCAPAVERPSAEVARESDIDAVKHHANVLWMTGHVVEAKAYWRVLAAAREAERLRKYVDDWAYVNAKWTDSQARVAALEAVLREVRWADPDRIAAALAAGKDK